MTNATMLEVLVGMGCQEWARGSHHRVYVPVAVSAAAIGLRVSRYNSGNVRSATLNGERISNSRAAEMLRELDGMYYDVGADRFVHSYYGAASALRARVAPAEGSL